MTFNHRLLALLLVSSSWSGFAGLHLTAAQAPLPPQEPAATVIPMELLANRPLVRVTVNGQGPFAFLIVPDSPRTLVDAELGEALKLRRPGNVTADAEVEIAFASRHTVKATVSVEDISRHVAEFPAAVRPRGIISLSVWGDQLVTLDYPRWKVSIEAGALAEPNGKEVFALNPSRELWLPLSIGDQSIECHVDPMFPNDLLVPGSFLVAEAPKTTRDVGILRTRDGVRRVREMKLASTATLGPFELKTPVVLLSDHGDTARIGASWLGRFEVTYDVAHSRIRIERPSGVITRQ